MTFRTPEEAFERANNIPYGLSAGVWTDKGSKIFKMVNKLRAGVVWANTYNKFDPTSPFGGYKESGFGREGGLQGLAAYCKLELGGAMALAELTATGRKLLRSGEHPSSTHDDFLTGDDRGWNGE